MTSSWKTSLWWGGPLLRTHLLPRSGIFLERRLSPVRAPEGQSPWAAEPAPASQVGSSPVASRSLLCGRRTGWELRAASLTSWWTGACGEGAPAALGGRGRCPSVHPSVHPEGLPMVPDVFPPGSGVRSLPEGHVLQACAGCSAQGLTRSYSKSAGVALKTDNLCNFCFSFFFFLRFYFILLKIFCGGR